MKKSKKQEGYPIIIGQIRLRGQIVAPDLTRVISAMISAINQPLFPMVIKPVSAKYERVKKTDLTLPAPLRWITRAFSSITLAVIFLCIVMLYGVAASVPVFFLFLASAYGGILLGSFGVALVLASGVIRSSRLPWILRALAVLALLSFAGAISYICCQWAYEWALTISFFAENRGTVLYRLPFFEMTEIEFYAWWPLRVVLILFVFNMAWATIRRIEFKFMNLGVLTVHTGIILLAIGSVVYGQFKVEGNMVLFRPDRQGRFHSTFYDATTPAIYLTLNDRQTSVPLDQLPRYNDYTPDQFNLPLNDWPNVATLLGDKTRVTLTGFYAYGQLAPRWIDAGEGHHHNAEDDAAPGHPGVELTLGNHDEPMSGQSVTLIAHAPAQRVLEAPTFALEFLDAPSEERLADLQTPLVAEHVLIVDIPQADYRETFAIEPGQTLSLGDTGYHLDIKDTGPYGLPFVTPGYRGATDTRALIHVEGPGKSFNRMAMHRYPERTQDFVPDPDDPNVGPMGRRRDPDPAIKLTYLDNTKAQYHLIKDPQTPSGLRMIFRLPGRPAIGVPLRDTKFPIPSSSHAPGITQTFWLHLTGWMDHAVQVTEPKSTPRPQRDPRDEGTYLHALLPVVIEHDQEDGTTWRQTHFLQFMQYPHLPDEQVQPAVVDVPGLGQLTLAFSRQSHELPFAIALERFEMQPYPGSKIPRDFVADLRIADLDPNGQLSQQPQRLSARLNNPITYHAPTGPWGFRKMKISQIGWDPGSPGDPNRDRVNEAGLFTNQQRYTVLGISNNVAINLIALGAIFIIVGIPWAFYVKPALLQRQKRKLQRQHT